MALTKTEKKRALRQAARNEARLEVEAKKGPKTKKEKVAGKKHENKNKLDPEAITTKDQFGEREMSYIEMTEMVQKVYRDRRYPIKKVFPEPVKPQPQAEVVKPLGCLSWMGRKAARLYPFRKLPKLEEYNMNPESMRAVQALCLNLENVQLLHDKFRDMDLVGNGQIDKFDFWDYLDVQPTQYTDKLFELIDSDGSGKIDFSEYCSLLVTYCMFNQEDILRFAFDCFDAGKRRLVIMMTDLATAKVPMAF